MSNSERKGNLPAIIKTVEPTFTELARRHGVPDFTFARESEFALQILKQNDYLAEIACGNPDSLKEAIVNVAAIGLSLSPINKQAYLVPRKRRVCLDISYQGFVDLGTSRGAIIWVKAELVHDKDQFEHAGVNKEPIHIVKNMFADRGPVIGGYCLAKMPTGDLLVDFMSIKEIYTIRDRSEGWKAFKSGKTTQSPWDSDEGEMIKKTLIRRAYKSWPKSVAKEVLNRALSVVNDSDGMEFDALPASNQEGPDPRREAGFLVIRQYLEALDRPESAYIEHLSRACNRSIKNLEDLTTLEIDQQTTFLEGVVETQKAKFEKIKNKEKLA